MVDGARWNAVYFLATFLALFVTLLLLTNGEAFDYPSLVTPPVSWTNVVPTDFSYWESAGVRPILLNGSFVCGFHCQFEGTACVFAISIFSSSVGGSSSFSPQMVWSANRNNPIGLWAKLQLSEEGDLILQDVHSTAVWSTRTAGKSVSGLKLTHQGNLVLFDRNGETVWQSFDHPTDSLVVGQRLVSGQRLVASMSVRNWSEGLYSFLMDDTGYFVAYAGLYTPLLYYLSFGSQLKGKTGQFYAELNDIGFAGFNFPSRVNFIQFGSDGHLRSFRWVESDWEKSYDLFHDQLDDPCDYPLACGEYGFCSEEGECKCLDPDENGKAYFKPINSNRSDLGCSPYVPISCKSPYHESLLEIKDASYPVRFLPPYSNITDIESCKQACLNNCSCKFAIFQSYSFNSSGQCSFGSEALSFKRLNEYYIQYYNVYYNGGILYFNSSMFSNSSVFLKVQNSPIVVQSSPSAPITQIAPIPQSPRRKKRQNMGVILGSTLGASFSVLLCVLLFLQIKKDPKDVEEDFLGHIVGTPTRFSYEELKVATNNFSNKLGEGGFGCVFQGTLPGGAQIAVKCLDGFGPIKKTFIAEVETIGSIHHFNLVRLVGFCAEKFRMLLVYEYMCNGSLDQWIFCRDKALALGWQCRRKIIVDIAKGLAYLHEECRQKIIHLDIKPQNILLDENFNAKVSDFGLSKLVGREQSQIVTTMRGTPGYMAPEWLNSVITEKVDVYSFGIVVLETLCGRKNVDRTQSEEDAHLVSLFKRKVEDGRLLDLLDKYNDEIQSNAAEVVEMMEVAAWCLQGEYAKRPSMSIVVKFLEGKMDNENEYGFSNPPAPAQVEILGHQMDAGAATASSIIPSTLSGPR